MTDTPIPPPSAEVPPPPTAPPRRWDWRKGATWFGAEFLVVVTGVLVALAVNAWWGDRSSGASRSGPTTASFGI